MQDLLLLTCNGAGLAERDAVGVTGAEWLSSLPPPGLHSPNVSAEGSGKSNNVSDLRKVFSPGSVATMVALGDDPRQWQGR